MPDYDKDRLEYMEGLREHLNEVFADFVIVGIDLNGDKGRIIDVGVDDEGSKSNSVRVARMVGELHDAMFNLQMFSNGFVTEEDDDDIGESLFLDNNIE